MSSNVNGSIHNAPLRETPPPPSVALTLLATILDGLCLFLRGTKFKERVATPIVIVGLLMLILTFPLFVMLGTLAHEAMRAGYPWLVTPAKFLQLFLPAIAVFLGLVSVSAGVSFRTGKTYRELFAGKSNDTKAH